MKKLLFTVAMLAISTTNSYAATAKLSKPATATAELVSALKIEQVTAMNFGKLVNTAGSATLTPAGTMDYANKIGETQQAAEFTVTGAVGTAITIVTDSSIELKNSTPGDTGKTKTMTVGTITKTVDGASQDTGTIPSDGTSTVKIGGTLTIGDNQADGEYSGTYNVTVNY